MAARGRRGSRSLPVSDKKPDTTLRTGTPKGRGVLRDGKALYPADQLVKVNHRGKRSETDLQIALFYTTSRLHREFQALARLSGLKLSCLELSGLPRVDWDSGRRFDAVLVEQCPDVNHQPHLLPWLRKLCPDVPLIALGAGSEPGQRSAYSLHLTELPSAGEIRSVVENARRHHQNAKKATTATRRLRETSRRLQVLTDIVSTANSSFEPERVMAVIMSQIQQLIPSQAWSILLVNEKRNELAFEMALGEKGGDFGDIRLKIGEGIAGWVAQTGKPAIVNDVDRDSRFQKRFDAITLFHTRSVLCAPLVSRGHTIGVVEILNREAGTRFTQRDLKLLLTLVEPAAIALENAILFQRAERSAVTDDVTRLYNSRYLNSYLGEELRRAGQEGSSLALIFLDLDGFKSVNDQHGHLCGSRALYEAGSIIKRSVREEEVVGRYGGDEFVVILLDIDGRGAMLSAERIRQALKAHPFLKDHGHQVRLSASLGVSCYPQHGSTPRDLIQKADQAMYSVKERGKDAVELAE